MYKGEFMTLEIEEINDHEIRKVAFKRYVHLYAQFYT